MCVDGRRKVLELILPGGRANDLAEGRVYNRGTRRQGETMNLLDKEKYHTEYISP